MKTKNILKAFGTINITLFIMGVFMLFSLPDISNIKEVLTDNSSNLVLVRLLLQMFLYCAMLFFLFFGGVNGFLSFMVNYDWKGKSKEI